MRTPILFLAAALLTASCASNSGKSTIINLNPRNCSQLEDVIDDCKVIFLDSTRNALITNPGKILCDSNYYYIQDRERHCIKVFGKDGHFVSQVNRVGRSSQEYLDIQNFDVKDETVYILSRSIQKLYEYDIRGKYLNSYELDYYYSDIVAVNNSTVLLFSNYSNNKMKNYVLFDLKTGKIVAECDDFTVNAGCRVAESHFIRTDEGIFTVKPFDYTIYQYDNNSINPVLTLNFDTEDALPKNDDIRVIYEQTEKKKVVRYYNSFTKVGDNVFVLYNLTRVVMGDAHLGLQFLTAANIKDSTAITITTFAGDEKFPFGFSNAFLHNGALYAFVWPSGYNRHVDAANAVDEESNLILLEYKLKCK
jgi:hypothetical protein